MSVSVSVYEVCEYVGMHVGVIEYAHLPREIFEQH